MSDQVGSGLVVDDLVVLPACRVKVPEPQRSRHGDQGEQRYYFGRFPGSIHRFTQIANTPGSIPVLYEPMEASR